MKSKKSLVVKNIKQYLFITIGVVLDALALELFLVPNNILDSGVVGISMLVSSVFNIRLTLLILIINLPIFIIIGWKFIGKKFISKSLYSLLIFYITLYLIHGMGEATNDVLLAFAFGGALLGLGSGIVLRYGGCLDGCEAIALAISKKTPYSVGKIAVCMNMSIYILAIFIYGANRAMYSILTYLVVSNIMDFVVEGLDTAKAVRIITSSPEIVSNEIHLRTGRTSTFIPVKGMISDEEMTMIYCVVTRLELSEIRDIVDNDDIDAFMTIGDVEEIVGRHIKKVSIV